MRILKKFWNTLKGAFSAFNEDNCMKLSASLSYYTIFSIGPLLMIIISLSALFLGEEAVTGKLKHQISEVIGVNAAVQIESFIAASKRANTGVIGTIVGGAILIIGATGIFAEIQDSINFIWSLKAKPKRGFVKYLINRLISFSLIISLGFLLLVSLVLSALMDLLSERLTRLFHYSTVSLFYVINLAVIFLVITLLFCIIFKVLPDGKIKWKDSVVGAAFTALLFLLGKAGIGYYLGRSHLDATYGTAASVIIILLWVYYTSIILYFGAEFTKVYALEYGSGIVPTQTSVFIIKRESREINTQPKHVSKVENGKEKVKVKIEGTAN